MKPSPFTVFMPPPQDVVAAAAAFGASADPTDWIGQSGAHSNQVWSVAVGNKSAIVKLFPMAWHNPLFDNTAALEAQALTHLHHLNLAPKLIGSVNCPTGEIVIYEKISGTVGRSPENLVGALLSQVHKTALENWPSLPKAANTAEIFQNILQNIPYAPRKKLALVTKKITWGACDQNPNKLIHFDPTPANIVFDGSSAHLIDWQTPKWGDPVHDVALYLSPSMRLNYGYLPIDETAEAEFFCGYGDPDLRDRWQRVKPQFSAILAAYVAWRIDQGFACHPDAFEAELENLQAV
ncbi:aminoglycoside phosphotransferase family protein [Algirhabdus cladophorae]|uniref:aminoglycoside phosphotransferase family protein n=1 Tax=Algirhabdus cladophorae TaxID=3377108 RepID=UPI003B847A9C